MKSDDLIARRRASYPTAVARWLLGLVLSVGGAALWVGFVTWFSVWLIAIWKDPQVLETRTVSVKSNGEPVVRIVRYQNQSGQQSIASQTFESLDGEPLTLTSAEQWSRDLRSWNLSHFKGGEKHPLWRRLPFVPYRYPNWSWREMPEPLPWAARLQSFSATILEPRRGTMWYFIWPERRSGTGYFVGYDIKTKARLGYLGVEGFSATVPPVAQQFPAWNQAGDQVAQSVSNDANQNFNHACMVNSSKPHIQEGLYFITPDRDRAYRISFTKRTVELVRQDLKLPIDFVSLCTVWGSQGHNIGTDRLLRFADRLEFVDLALQPTNVISLPEELRDSNAYLAARESGGYFAIPEVSHLAKKNPTYDQLLLWLDDEGNVTQRRTMTFPNSRTQLSVANDGRLMLPLSLIPANGLAVLGLSPFVPMFDDSGEVLFKPSDSITWASVANAMRLQSDRFGWPLWICLLSGLPFAVACSWRQRRVATSWPERLAWLALVYVFGLAGWIAFVAHRKWPARRANSAA